MGYKQKQEGGLNMGKVCKRTSSMKEYLKMKHKAKAKYNSILEVCKSDHLIAPDLGEYEALKQASAIVDYQNLFNSSTRPISKPGKRIKTKIKHEKN